MGQVLDLIVQLLLAETQILGHTVESEGMVDVMDGQSYKESKGGAIKPHDQCIGTACIRAKVQGAALHTLGAGLLKTVKACDVNIRCPAILVLMAVPVKLRCAGAEQVQNRPAALLRRPPPCSQAHSCWPHGKRLPCLCGLFPPSFLLLEPLLSQSPAFVDPSVPESGRWASPGMVGIA